MQVTRKKVSDILGHSFGRLVVTDYLGIGRHNKHYWNCLCICRNTIILPTYRITGAKPTVSCGCLRQETLLQNRFDGFKHGLHDTKLYAIYHAMLQRCYNPKSQRYKYYGSKGIEVCNEWKKSFEVFYSWSCDNGYSNGLSIDRLDSNGNYEPSNCQWVTVSENSRRMNFDRRRKV